METNLLAAELIKVAEPVASKPIASFSELVALKFFGKSIAKLKAEAEIEAVKVKTRWEEIEKPLWIQAETIKINRQYSNLGRILNKAKPFIVADNKITDDNDVFWGLLEHSKEISNEQVQSLIARIIAGEYNNPGSHSMSTLHVLKSLSKKELEMFEFFGSFLIDKELFLAALFN